MFILVKYGNNETLLCNPSCAVINLLSSIKKRAGYGNTDLVVDIADETGLVKELDTHKSDHAHMHLTSHTTYVLVQKEILPGEAYDPRNTPYPPQYTYIPLLEKYQDLFPNFSIRSAEIQMPLKAKSRIGKSPSPAGRYSTKQGRKSTGGKITSKRK